MRVMIAGTTAGSTAGGVIFAPHTLSDAQVEQVAARFRVLGEPMRLRLLMALAAGECTVGELVARTGAGQANVSKHLAALAQVGMVRRRKAGTSTYYAIADDTAFTLCEVVCAGLQRHVAAQALALGVATATPDASEWTTTSTLHADHHPDED